MLRIFPVLVLGGLLCMQAHAPAATPETETTPYVPEDVIAERGTILITKPSQKSIYGGEQVDSNIVRQQDHGLILPNGNGGLVIMPGQPNFSANANLLDARELRLKIRELASQLVETLPLELREHIALPLTFVTQDDFSRTSSLGRYIAEQLYYEFNQRGMRTREYRLDERISFREDGEFVLSRQKAGLSLDERSLYVLGTYYSDGHILLINAKLIRYNGDILRTGQLVMNAGAMSRRLMAAGRKLQEGSLEIMDFNTEARPVEAVTAFDRGLDIH
ncbi:MAG: FlgO family outer membrane protein [Desulfovibrionaceae bacterium]|nr:FlgO family outer membrane protein [Desulfovibrionaceae bacterium]